MRRSRHFVDVKILLFLASIVFLFSSVSPAVAQDIPDLFTSGTVTTNFVMERAPDTARVSIDFSLLQRSSSHTIIRAALPDRTVTLFRTRIEKRGTDNYTWFGKARSDELSSAVFTVVKGIMYGHIDIKGDCYEIGPGQGAYVVTKRNPAEAMPLLDDTLVPKLPASEGLFPEAGAAAENGSQIDVLALYTEQMQAKYGSGLDAKIQSLIDLTNEAYVNSGVSTHLRLAGTALYSDPHAAEGNATDTALNYITDDPTAGSLRDQYGADLVSLLRVFNSTDNGCGTAWVMTPATSTFESNAYSVVEVGSYGSYYCDDTTLAHELGHNMGCQHDRAHANSSGAYPYSYGYGLDNQFGTIMSYIPPIITYFSTPVLSYDGLPIGVADDAPDSADNVTTINNTRIIVANFRAPVSSGCSFTVSPLSQSFGSSGGAGSIDITAGSGCSWSVVNGLGWVSITSGENGTGSGTVGYLVSANNGSFRSGTMTVAGKTFTISQEGLSSGSRIGVFRDGTWFFDMNGDGTWDAGDVQTSFGQAGDIPVIGDWNGNGKKKMGVFRDGTWFFDMNGDGTWDTGDVQTSFGQAGDMPVTGDWNGDGKDKIGVFRDGNWYLDYNGNGVWDGCSVDRCYTFGLSSDIPVAGDWDGSRYDKIGVFRNGAWYLDMDGSGTWNSGDITAYFGMTGDVPVVGDWNGSGTSKLGVKRGTTWYLDTDGSYTWNSGDSTYIFGSAKDMPVAGNW